MTRVENPMVTGEWPYDTPHKGEGPRTHHLADIEDGYIRTKPQRIIDEAYLIAINGMSFEEEK